MWRSLRTRTLSTILACTALTAAKAQNVGINFTGAAPHANAALDLSTTARGMLIPRMNNAQFNAFKILVGSPAPADEGLWVYRSEDAAPDDPNNRHGFYFFDGTSWIRWAVGGTAWSMSGNNPATGQFLGTLATSPNKDLIFRTVTPSVNPQMRFNGVAATPYLGIGTAAAATERVQVNGGVRIGNSVATPTEGAIKYGTDPSSPYNYHYGRDAVGWKRMENAEELVTPPQPYAKDTLKCLGVTGDAFRGALGGTPQTGNANTPFPTNAGVGNTSFRVQYLYRYSELVAAPPAGPGLCLPGQITAVSFYVLDDETLGPPQCSVSGEIRVGVATCAPLTGPAATFGKMDDGVRTLAVPGPQTAQFLNLTPSAGWLTFTLSSPVTINANQNLIVDLAWRRGTVPGISPKVEVEAIAGFTATRWVLLTGAAISTLDDDNGAACTVAGTPNPGTATVGTSAFRPVTRFAGPISTAAVTPATANYIRYEGGVMIGSAAWASGANVYKGPGTIRAEKGIYDGNVLLSDHVFDRYFDGRVQPADAKQATDYTYVALPDLREHLETERHLPNMPSRAEWERSGKASLGTLQTGLWETVETQALYITQLEKDLSTLEALAFGPDLDAARAQALIADVERSPRLSEAQKLHLTAALRQRATAPERATEK